GRAGPRGSSSWWRRAGRGGRATGPGGWGAGRGSAPTAARSPGRGCSAATGGPARPCRPGPATAGAGGRWAATFPTARPGRSAGCRPGRRPAATAGAWRCEPCPAYPAAPPPAWPSKLTGKPAPAAGITFHIVEGYDVGAVGAAPRRFLNKLLLGIPWGEGGRVPGLPAQPERQHAPGRGVAARDPGRHPPLRGRAGPRRRVVQRLPGRHSRHHRAQRRREDEPAQLHQRAVPAPGRGDPLPPQRRLDQEPGADQAREHRPARHRPDVPEHRAVPAHDRPREPDARAPRPHAPPPVGVVPVLRAGAAPGDPGARARRGGHRPAGDPVGPQQAGRGAGLRVPEAGGDGPGAVHAAGRPAARRADGGDERRGEGGHGPLHPGRERAGRGDHRAHRARHGSDHGHLRPGQRPRLRSLHRRRHPGRGGQRPGRARRLPRPGGPRVSPLSLGKVAADPLPIDDDTTFPKLLAELDRRYGDGRVAVQEKRYGIWQPLTWHQLHGRVRDFAHGLAALGVQPGEVVAVLGDNRPEWLISELAAQSLGACTVGIYPTSVGEEIVHVLTDGRVRVVVAEDQEQVDKIIELKDRLPGVERVIYYDTRGLELYEVPYLSEFTAVEAAGREWAEAHPGWLDEQIAAGRADDVAVICTTSGTTGRPKLAMLSHANLLCMGRSLNEVDPIGRDARYLSFLPLAWIGEQMIAVATGLQLGFTLSFAEEAATQRADLRELGPNVMFSPPRIWEDMLSSIMVRVGEAGWAKRKTFA